MVHILENVLWYIFFFFLLTKNIQTLRETQDHQHSVAITSYTYEAPFAMKMEGNAKQKKK